MICLIYAAAGVLVALVLAGLLIRANKNQEFFGWTNQSTWSIHQSLIENKDSCRYWTKRAGEVGVDDLVNELLQAHSALVYKVPDDGRRGVVNNVGMEVNWDEIAKDSVERSVLRFDKTDR